MRETAYTFPLHKLWNTTKNYYFSLRFVFRFFLVPPIFPIWFFFSNLKKNRVVNMGLLSFTDELIVLPPTPHSTMHSTTKNFLVYIVCSMQVQLHRRKKKEYIEKYAEIPFVLHNYSWFYLVCQVSTRKHTDKHEGKFALKWDDRNSMLLSPQLVNNTSSRKYGNNWPKDSLKT